jgi:hypothetical protein
MINHLSSQQPINRFELSHLNLNHRRPLILCPAVHHTRKPDSSDQNRLRHHQEAMLIKFKAVGIREEVKVGIKWRARRSMSETTEKLVDGRKGRRGLEKILACIDEKDSEYDGEEG